MNYSSISFPHNKLTAISVLIMLWSQTSFTTRLLFGDSMTYKREDLTTVKKSLTQVPMEMLQLPLQCRTIIRNITKSCNEYTIPMSIARVSRRTLSYLITSYREKAVSFHMKQPLLLTGQGKVLFILNGRLTLKIGSNIYWRERLEKNDFLFFSIPRENNYPLQTTSSIWKPSMKLIYIRIEKSSLISAPMKGSENLNNF